jgi:FG-GAP-like repeat/PASTA domain
MTARAPRRLTALACATGVFALAIAGAAATGSGPTFRSKLFFGAVMDDGAASVTVGDVNGDGRPDVLAANVYPDDSVSVELNQGHGDFKLRDYSLSSAASSVTLAELNGDGKPDLVVATEQDDSGGPYGVSVLLNKGGGMFRRGPDTVLAADTLGAVGDVNGDGKADIVAVDAKHPAIGLFLNRGGGGFDAAPERYETGRGVSAVALADVNRDGKADVATANFADSTISLLLNRGDGSLAPKIDFRTGAKPDAIAVQDMNGDRRPDLVTENVKPSGVSVLMNRGGDGRFAARRDYRTSSCFSSELLAIGDVNGDGNPDIATACVSVLVNKGDGSFRPKLDYDYQFEPLSLAIGDLTGDHRRDLIVLVHNDRNGDNWLAVLVNAPGVCNVQPLAGLTLLEAKRMLARVNCRLGRVGSAHSSRVAKGLVLSQKPAFGTVRPGGTRVDLVLSMGRR